MALRRDELLVKLRDNEISRSESVELNDMLIEEQRAAQERNDTVALIAITLGLIVLAPKLARRGMNWQLIKQVGMKVLAVIAGIVGGIALAWLLRKVSDHREAKQKVRVAAFNSSDKNKAKADYLCDGIDDHIEIQAALDAMASIGAKGIYFASGTYKLTGKATEVDTQQELERSVGKLVILGIKRVRRALRI